ncbi:MAG: pyridoxamine 5'-phosphate oxidase family protein [Blastocatellia bacterium]
MSDPKTTRPHMPGYGLPDAQTTDGLFSWTWARERLTSARTYWLATMRPDARPHAMPVWGIWHDNHFYFSTGRQSRKARNLAANPHCVVTMESGEETVIVEGIVTEITDTTLRQRFCELYGPKYEWSMEAFAEPVFVVRPTVAFGFDAAAEQFTQTATRWTFPDEEETQ